MLTKLLSLLQDPERVIAFGLEQPMLSLAVLLGVLLVLGAVAFGVASLRRRRRVGQSAPFEAETTRETVDAPQRVRSPEAEAQPAPQEIAVEALAPATAVPSPEAEQPVEPLPLAPPPRLVVVEEPPVAKPARASLRERLAKTSDFLIGGLERALGTRKLEGEVVEQLEDLLFTADLGVKTAESLLQQVRDQASGRDAAAVREVLRSAILQKLEAVESKGESVSAQPLPHPYVILVLGVNGSGKTTTIGKLAGRYVDEGKHVLLGAGDTFRAAAIEQLQVWGARVGCEVIVGSEGGDPAAVAFDTIKAGVARDADVVIIDTAGRLQTKQPLIEELRKIVRVIGREVPSAPHETLLVLDANTGQNAISQARVFIEAAGVTGLVLTKLDGTAKGGVLVGLADEFGIPVRYVGVGEAVEDLRDFSARAFVGALFGDDALS